MAASRCLRRASSWARAFCFLLILPLRVSLELLRRRKLKLERREALWERAAVAGRALSSGEPSRAAPVDMAGGRRRDAVWGTGDGRRATGDGRAHACVIAGRDAGASARD